MKETDTSPIDLDPVQDASGFFLGSGIVNQDMDVFGLMQMADDFAVDPGNWGEFAGPISGALRPGDPGGLVRLPLGRHVTILWDGLKIRATEWDRWAICLTARGLLAACGCHWQLL
jgi:hypothetical protein